MKNVLPFLFAALALCLFAAPSRAEVVTVRDAFGVPHTFVSDGFGGLVPLDDGFGLGYSSATIAFSSGSVYGLTPFVGFGYDGAMFRRNEFNNRNFGREVTRTRTVTRTRHR